MIKKFRGKYRFLSNFYETEECQAQISKVAFYSIESAFQAMKVLDPETEELEKFAKSNPRQAKAMGRKAVLREDWDNIKLDVMYALVRQKFQISELSEMLIGTGDQDLIEGNTWGDVFWGVNTHNGYGENHLGKILMKIREELCA